MSLNKTSQKSPCKHKISNIYNSEKLLIYIKSNKVELYDNKKIKFSGNVTVKQNNITFNANEINIYKQTKKEKNNLLIAKGNINFNNGKLELKGNKAISNINNKNLDIYQGTYNFLTQKGCGNANILMQRDNQRYLILKEGNVSFCIPHKKHWSIQGSEIIYDNKKEKIDIWNAYCNIGKIPVLFIPYLSLPTNIKNTSGILIPNLQYTNQYGFNLNLPYYLNINSYSNMILSPKYNNKQGIQLYTTFNYKGPLGINLIKFNILQYNKPYYNKNYKYQDMYWYLYWKCTGNVSKTCRFNSDYTKISNYYTHQNNNKNVKNINNNYTTQKLWFDYNNKNLNIRLSIKKFEPHKYNNNNIYQTLPQLDININKYKNQSTALQISSQITNFININPTLYPQTVRLHIEPSIKIPFNNRFGSIYTESKIKMTHYQQKKAKNYKMNKHNTNNLKPTVTRIIPQFKIEGKTTLKKQNQNRQQYIQTLEPQLQYKYTPYHNQKNIGIYDSSIMFPINYIELFRDSLYNSIDRIPSTNQLTSAITMRIYNKNKKEIFSTSGGQIYCFSKPRTGDPNNFLDKYGKIGNMLWLINNHWYINNKYCITHNMQYNSNFHFTTINEAILEYKKDQNHILKFSWNYTNIQFLKKILSNNKINKNKNNNSQINVTGIWMLNKKLSLKNSCNYNIYPSYPITNFTSIKYTAHCWTAHISYERKIHIYNNNTNKPSKYHKYDNKISFNLKFPNFNK